MADWTVPRGLCLIGIGRWSGLLLGIRESRLWLSGESTGSFDNHNHELLVTENMRF